MTRIQNIRNKNAKAHQDKPVMETLEKEIEDLIDWEKTKNRILSKLLNQANQKKTEN